MQLQFFRTLASLPEHVSSNYNLEHRDSYQVSNLKRYLEARTTFSADHIQIHLTQNDNPLEDHEIIQTNKCFFTYIYCNTNHCPTTEITVTVPYSDGLKIKIGHLMNVSDLKKLIEKQINIPKTQMQLRYEGSDLDNEQLLNQLLLDDRSQIELYPRGEIDEY